GASRGTEGRMDVRRIEEEVDPDFLPGAHSRTGPAESGDSCESKAWNLCPSFYRFRILSSCVRMRELVVKYKAEKVCHAEMVKMPLVDLKVLEVYTKSKEEHELHLKINLELLKKEKCHVKPNKTDGQSERTFQTLENMFRACVRNLVVVGILTFYEAEIGESKIIRLELEQEMTKVVVNKEKEAKYRQESAVRFGKKCELAPRYIGPFEILERIVPVAYRLRLPDELSIENYLSGVKILSKPEIALIV
nr:hypothetical protein [Tanacetum cinerariifolium]